MTENPKVYDYAASITLVSHLVTLNFNVAFESDKILDYDEAEDMAYDTGEGLMENYYGFGFISFFKPHEIYCDWTVLPDGFGEV